MPRPVFGAADWWTFEELQDDMKFHRAPKRYEEWSTIQECDADSLARVALGDDADGTGPNGPFHPTWPDLEFCVSRGTKTVLMVRRRTT